MKVHLYGNTLNCSYDLTKYLRAMGIDAIMFLDNFSVAKQDYPKWEDKDMDVENYPEWIRYYNTKPFFLIPNKVTQQMISDFGACDVALVCGFGPIVAMKAKVPFIFYSIGSDLNCIDIREEIMMLFKTKLPLTRKFGRLVKMLTYTPLQIKAIKKHANLIMVFSGYQLNPYIKKHGLLYKTITLRWLFDIGKYTSVTNKELSCKYKNYDIVFFMVARHNWKSVWTDIKGNDKFLHAFASFVKKSDDPNVKLILINKGDDVSSSKEIIESENIEEYVEWVDQMDKDGIRSFESLSNCVVVDQFWHDEWFKRYPADRLRPAIGFGFGSIEALSASRPLITVFFDENFYGDESPPIFKAFTKEEIEVKLEECYGMSAGERMELGKKGREFVLKYHHWENNIGAYIDALKKVADENQQR